MTNPGHQTGQIDVLRHEAHCSKTLSGSTTMKRATGYAFEKLSRGIRSIVLGSGRLAHRLEVAFRYDLYYLQEHDLTQQSWPKFKGCLDLMTSGTPLYAFEDTFHASVRGMHWRTQKKILGDLIDVYEDTLLNWGRT